MTTKNYSHTVSERLMRYVQIDTQSDPNSMTQPSTEKQKDLSRVLVDELKAIGIADAELDQHGYVYATIPATTDKEIPVICFCAHVDTSPDCSGTGVKPILHQNWDGKDIVLPNENSVIISQEKFPYLKGKIGEDIITTSGLTLLGADDKAGVAVIMDLANFLVQNPQVKHGKIRLLFTPDEEIGRGVDKVDIKKLGADFGYTLDGGHLGELENETFSADEMKVTFHGISMHPAYGKDKLVNAVKIASAFISSLPKNEWSPETTEGMEGFVHPVTIEGHAEKATIHLIVRDFDTKMLAVHEERLQKIAQATLVQFPGARVEFVIKEQYRNMREVLDNFPQVIAYAETACKRSGIEVIRQSIRGGTDGSRLSFMGLPCPNLFSGQNALHSHQEFITVQDMQKSVAMLVELVQVWEEAA
jgi:tripeptide aminopeptidase